jgi:cytoskeletal protein CcmA (bactofilin family)
MGIFNRRDEMAMDTSETTVIAKGTKVIGEIDIQSKLHIDGEIEGKIKSTNIVTVGSSGVVNGEIVADKLLVSGQMDGNCDCENIEILAGGKITGDIVSSNLVIESNGFFEGTSKIKVKNQDMNE